MPQQSDIEIQLYKFRHYYEESCLIEIGTGASFNANPSTGSPIKEDGELRVPANYKIKMIKKPGRHKVRFTITTPSDSQEKVDTFRLVGIYFRNEEPVSPDPEGRNVGKHVFEKFECDFTNTPPNTSPSLTLDINRDKVKRDSAGKAEREEYEFFLLVQRERDGAFGIIDPEWENE